MIPLTNHDFQWGRTVRSLYFTQIYEISRHFSSRVADKLPIAPWAEKSCLAGLLPADTREKLCHPSLTWEFTMGIKYVYIYKYMVYKSLVFPGDGVMTIPHGKTSHALTLALTSSIRPVAGRVPRTFLACTRSRRHYLDDVPVAQLDGTNVGLPHKDMKVIGDHHPKDLNIIET